MRHSPLVSCMRQSWDIQPKSHVWDNHETFSLSLIYETVMRHSPQGSCMRQSRDIHHTSLSRAPCFTGGTLHQPHPHQCACVLVCGCMHVYVCMCACACPYSCVCTERYEHDYAKFYCDSILNIDDMKWPMYPTTAHEKNCERVGVLEVYVTLAVFLFCFVFSGGGVGGGDFFFVLYFVHCHPWQLVNMWWVSI